MQGIVLWIRLNIITSGVTSVGVWRLHLPNYWNNTTDYYNALEF